MARILLIDDQEHIRNIIKQILLIDGYEVDTAENGKAGLKMVQLHCYDLVITDIFMPEQDGLEVIMELRQQFPDIRIIVMTGGGAKLDIAHLLKMSKYMGADRLFPKPIDFVKLRAAVKEVLTMEK
jgi:CheY-like chemotaxis protein